MIIKHDPRTLILPHPPQTGNTKSENKLYSPCFTNVNLKTWFPPLPYTNMKIDNVTINYTHCFTNVNPKTLIPPHQEKMKSNDETLLSLNPPCMRTNLEKSNFWDQVPQKVTYLGTLVIVSMLTRGFYTSSNLYAQRKPKSSYVISMNILPCKLTLKNLDQS